MHVKNTVQFKAVLSGVWGALNVIVEEKPESIYLLVALNLFGLAVQLLTKSANFQLPLGFGL